MTKTEAVQWLCEYRDENTLLNVKPNPYGRPGVPNDFECNVYLDGLVNILIHDIYTLNVDPVTIVADMYYRFDDVLAESEEDHFVTHNFCAYMEYLTHDMYNYLCKKEKQYGNC